MYTFYDWRKIVLISPEIASTIRLNTVFQCQQVTLFNECFDRIMGDESLERINRWNTVPQWMQWDIINRVIKEMGYKTYLEIGVDDGQCHKRVDAVHRVGVDPEPRCKVSHRMGSDEFFAQNDEKFDIIFIDGDHRWQQVIRDMDNALKVLSEGGTILMHDCLACVKRSSTPVYTEGLWFGTAWKAFCLFRMLRADVSMWTIDAPMGIGVVRPGHQELYSMPSDKELNWDYYWAHLPEVMNLVSVDDFFGNVLPEWKVGPNGKGPDC